MPHTKFEKEMGDVASLLSNIYDNFQGLFKKHGNQMELHVEKVAKLNKSNKLNVTQSATHPLQSGLQTLMP